LAVTVSAMAGLAIVVTAPGNAHRLVVDGGSHGRHLAYDLGIAIGQAGSFIPRWILSPRLVAASVWVAFSPTLAAEHRIKAARSSSFSWQWMLPVVWLAMLGIGFFAPSWAFGARMPPRTLSGVYIVFVVGWLVNVHVWAGSARTRSLTLSRSSSTATRAACLVLAFTLLATGNAPAAIYDFYDRVGPWHMAVEKRFALLRNQGGTDATMPQLPSRFPTLLLSGEAVSDPEDYRNWGMVCYFKLRSLRLISSSGLVAARPQFPTHPPGGGSGT
jgi:hypothetical protein